MKAVSAEEAVAMIPNGATVMVGGFMGVGTPERLLDELVRQRKSELSIISNDAAFPGKGVGKLFDASLVSTLTASHIGLNPNVQKQMMTNKVAVNLVPQGTFVERIRAGGCGLGGVLTPTGVGTIVEEGKRKIEVDGKSFLLETALRCGFRADPRIPGGLSRQSHLRADGAQLQSRHGDGGRHRHRHGRAHRSGRRHRARPCRDARAARRLSHRQWVNHGCPIDHCATRGARTSLRQPGQSRHRNSDPGRELRSARPQGFLPVGKRIDRHRTNSGARHGPSAAHGCRRTADQCPARRVHLRQRDVVRADPRRACRRDRARRPSGRCRRASRELDDPRQDGAGDGRRDGPRDRRQARHRRHAARRKGKVEDRAEMRAAADLVPAGRSGRHRHGGDRLSRRKDNAAGDRARASPLPR